MRTLSRVPEDGLHVEQKFANEGYLDPFPILSANEVHPLLAAFRACLSKYPELGPMPAASKSDLDRYWNELGSKTVWFKSAHQYVDGVSDLVRSPSIVGVLHQILGPNVILWGSQFICKQPGEDHGWHIDIETLDWPSVNVWIGLENTDKDASLKLVSSTHSIDSITTLPRHLSDDDALSLAKKFEPSCQMIYPNVEVGSAFIFNGRAWHGSRNMGSRNRTALLLQYSRSDVSVRIPSSFGLPTVWHTHQPGCLRVSGDTFTEQNKYI